MRSTASAVPTVHRRFSESSPDRASVRNERPDGQSVPAQSVRPEPGTHAGATAAHAVQGSAYRRRTMLTASRAAVFAYSEMSKVRNSS